MSTKSKQLTLLQGFEWYLPDDGKHWDHIASEAKKLHDIGITGIWLPPAYKCTGGIHDVGYGVYDMYDLGEFDQKGSVSTKYGTKQQYLNAIKTLQSAGIKVYADIVFNHRMGADGTEEVRAVMDDSNNRNNTISSPSSILAWTKYTFPGRNGQYSDFTWNASHFDGVDWDDKEHKSGVYLFEGKNWEENVDTELGNYDYLMGADLDMDNQEVIDELDRWGKWYLDMTNVDGFRLDAVKHIRFNFYTHWLTRLRNESGKELPTVAEYWSPDVSSLCHYLDASGHVANLFDVPLHFNLHKASSNNGNFDMRNILSNTFVEKRPEYAVTFVDNHDTQPGQALESFIPAWFKPLAYSLILLRKDGIPCIFYGDLYGIPHNSIAPVKGLTELIKARKLYAYGTQTDYFDHANIIGWTRSGLPSMKHSGLAVIMSDGPCGSKYMCMGVEHAGEIFVDLLGNCPDKIVLDETGSADFKVDGGSVSVWISEEACERL
ncbi:MAG: alpha-amylase [Coprococcus sp.]